MIQAGDCESVRFSVRFGAGQGMAYAVDAARTAEEAGFDQGWIGNDIFGPSGVVALSAALSATSRIRLGSGVLDMVSLNPAQVAMVAAGLQDLSAGRFLLGLGAGSDVFFSWAGLTPERPLRRTREGLLAVRALLQGRTPAEVPGTASGWQQHAMLTHPPAQDVPIYVGAMGPRMLQLAGAHADGALPLCLPPSRFHAAREEVRRGATSAGRVPDELDLAACLWTALDEDRDVARHSLARFIAKYSGSLSVDALAAEGLDPDEFTRVQQMILDGRTEDAVAAVTPRMLQLGVVGGPDEVVEQCLALLDAGVRHISFGPPLGTDPLRAIRLIGQHVLPRIRAAA